MAISFLATTLIAASVVLVPKNGKIEKSQTQIPAELLGESPAKVKVIEEKPHKEEVIKLRKAKKQKPSKYAKSKKNSKNKKSAEREKSETEFDAENLDEIYKKEREYFERTGKKTSMYRNQKRKLANSGGVKGPLASIPTAVADSLAKSSAIARAPEEKPVVITKQEPKTPEELFNVEETIQDKSTVAQANLPKKLPAKKIEKEMSPSKVKIAKNVNSFKTVEIKDELFGEVTLAEEGLTSESKSKRSIASVESKIDIKEALRRIEKKYVTHYVKASVQSDVTQALLERTKTYTGKLFIAPGGRFKMDITEPNKHMVLMNGKNIWVVDYPLDEMQDKVQIIHSKNPKNLKNQAFLDIFEGVGKLEKRFKIEGSEVKNDQITYKLIPKEKGSQVERVELELDNQSELITSISFWDSLGNKTQLKFKEQDFSEKTNEEVFKFKPPKEASITYL